MDIKEMPLSESFRITTFYGRHDYSLSKDGGTVLFNNSKYIVTDFNKRYPNHKIYKFVKLTNDILKDFYEEAKINIDTTNELDYLINFLKSNGVEKFDDNLHLIFPKTSKKLSGKKHLIEFSVGTLDFGYGEDVKQDLEVFITPITKTSKSVKYSMYIPDFLYDQCMLLPIIEERPTKKYIESETLRGLHSSISDWVSKAHKLWVINKEANEAKKVLCINFYSTENFCRDNYNHAYIGQEIKTYFNFYVAYQTKQKELFTFSKYQSGMGTTERGISGVLDTSLTGKRNWISKGIKVGTILEWSEEKEEFLKKLENEFRKLSSKLNDFLKDLDEAKLKSLIDNQTKLLND